MTAPGISLGIDSCGWDMVDLWGWCRLPSSLSASLKYLLWLAGPDSTLDTPLFTSVVLACPPLCAESMPLKGSIAKVRHFRTLRMTGPALANAAQLQVRR